MGHDCFAFSWGLGGGQVESGLDGKCSNDGTSSKNDTGEIRRGVRRHPSMSDPRGFIEGIKVSMFVSLVFRG